MTWLNLRDRDAIVTDNKMILRVYGYSHPRLGYICDPEYAPANIHMSNEPRAHRASVNQTYYKFYADEGLQFIQEKHPEYMLWYPPLQRMLVGVKKEQIAETRRPGTTLQNLIKKEARDPLLQALDSLLSLIQAESDLSTDDFGVFGSLLHNFYHPAFSDLDFTVYGRNQLGKLRETLSEIYQGKNSSLKNEFDTMESVREKDWKFLNYSLDEYVWHQKRKQIYAVFHQKQSRRMIKAEFEPVKRWEEIQNENLNAIRIQSKGWIRIVARVTNDKDAPFMPSIYQIEPTETLEGQTVDDIQQVVSFIEEFRLQAQKDESILVEGNLEQVNMPNQSFQQVTLTYGPRYYEQVLKIAKI